MIFIKIDTIDNKLINWIVYEYSALDNNDTYLPSYLESKNVKTDYNNMES